MKPAPSAQYLRRGAHGKPWIAAQKWMCSPIAPHSMFLRKEFDSWASRGSLRGAARLRKSFKKFCRVARRQSRSSSTHSAHESSRKRTNFFCLKSCLASAHESNRKRTNCLAYYYYYLNFLVRKQLACNLFLPAPTKIYRNQQSNISSYEKNRALSQKAFSLLEKPPRRFNIAYNGRTTSIPQGPHLPPR